LKSQYFIAKFFYILKERCLGNILLSNRLRRGREGERERGKEGERERGREGERERGKFLGNILLSNRLSV
jgi:hypothetical protein